MTDKTDTPSTEPKTAADFEKMPDSKEFATLSRDVQNELVDKFDDGEGTPDEESEASTEEIPEKETPKEEGSSKKTEKETSEKPKDGNWEKRYKDLQREYTSVTEENKDLKQPSKKAPDDTRSKFDHLREANPKATDFFNSLEAAIDERMGERVKPLTDRLNFDKSRKNEQSFLAEIDKFLDGDLKELQPELEEIIAETIGTTKEALAKAAGENPNLFRELKKDLLDKHLDKVVEIKSKAVDPNARHKEIKDTGVSGKPRTAPVEGSTDLDIKALKGLKTYQDMKKALDKEGAVDETAKPRQWRS